ncbi:MAG: hypothetical protein C0511_05415 [Hyphomicrobium sp.]|nr:hypothetical protein [Hyphomicrobium sp.]
MFVFVHGLNSNNYNAWQYEADNERTYWPELVKQDSFLSTSDNTSQPPSILLASFHTSPGSRSFGIAEARQQIFDAIFNSIEDQPPAIEKKTVILVGHSLGGVLLRDVLSQYSERFLGKRLGLLLVGSPSKGSNFANIASYAQWVIDNTMVKELERGSVYLNKVHQRFAASIGPEGSLRFLVGRELYEHLGMLESAARCAANSLSIVGVACAAKQRLYSIVEGGPVVPEDSAVVYWPSLKRQIPQSDHFSISRPTDAGHPSHQALRELVDATQQAAINPCMPPQDFGVAFQIQGQETTCGALGPSNDTSPKFELLQLNTNDGKPLRSPLDVQFDPLVGVYRLPISGPPFPCANELFWGKLVHKVRSSRRMTVEPCATDLCFRRSKQNATSKFAQFKCVAGNKCLLPDASPGVAEVCQETDLTPIMVALPKPGKQDYWISPSLETLENTPAAQKPGYTEFFVVSEPLTQIPDQVSVGFAVQVNGKQVRFDGMPPYFQRQTVTKGSRLHITFPIENLGFRGGNNGSGFEDIKVQIRFFSGDTIVGTATLQRPYIAYRHGAVVRTTDIGTGETFSWRAIYRPATSGENFEVMIEHGADAAWMNARREVFDRLEKRIEGAPVVGVLRPGRAENARIGMILGLVQENGQVRSLFSKRDAEQVCRWIQEQPEFNQLQKEASYIFEFPLETIGDVIDRGRRVTYCEKIQE